MTEAGAIGLAAAFAAGFISFVSPCVLPLVPAYVSYVAGQPLREEARRPDASERLAALSLSGFFVLGFSAVFVTLGVPFLLVALFAREPAGRIKGLRRFGTLLQIAAGLILVVMGIGRIG
ncbi:MAG: cytochrome c biogenesis CcdA family protein [bacterium]